MIECHASCLKEGSSSSSSGSKGMGSNGSNSSKRWASVSLIPNTSPGPNPTGPITQPPPNDMKMFVKMSLVLSALLTCV